MAPVPQAKLSEGRDPALDGLRGLAITLVFLFHYGGGLRAHNPLVRVFGYVSQAGWMGVNLFFALSGFLITRLLAKNLFSEGAFPGSHVFRNFFARRALRILPLYLVALLACALAALLAGAAPPQLRPLLVYVAFLQNLPPFVQAALHTPPPLPIFHLWSLAVEEQFYLLWPLVLLLAGNSRRAVRFSLFAFAASCLFRALVFTPLGPAWFAGDTWATFLPSRCGALVLGSALALWQISRERTLTPSPDREAGITAGPPRSVLFAITAVALGLVLLTASLTHSFQLKDGSSYVFVLPAVDLLSASLVALALQPNLFRSLLSAGPLAQLGRVSYGFYVFHILLEPVFDRLGTAVTHAHAGFAYQTARLIIAFPLTLAVAMLSFAVLERPFLRLKRRFPESAPWSIRV